MSFIERIGELSALPAPPTLDYDVSFEKTRQVAVFEKLARLSSGRLLTAENPDDFSRIVDELCGELDVASAYHMLVDLCAEQSQSVSEPSTLRPETAELIGPEAARHLAEATPLLSAVQATARHFQRTLQTLGRVELKDAPTRPLDWFVGQRGVPVALSRCWLDTIHGGLCSVALGLVFHTRERPAAWWSVLAVDKLVQGARSYLRWTSTLPGVEVPFEVIAKAERLDLDKIFQEHRDGVNGLRLLALQHRAANRPITKLHGELGLDHDDH